MKRMRVAIYARYSSDLQNPKSAEDQIRECRAYAKRSGYEIVKEFSDAELSGALRDRPQYQALLDAVRNREFDIVLFENIDRLGRDIERISNFYKTATHEDIEIHQLGKGKLGLFDIGIMSTIAAMFLEEVARKTHRGLSGKIAGGKSAGGLAYGYRVRTSETGEVIKGELDIDPVESEIIRRIYSEYAAGKSPLKIAAGLNEDGVPAPRGRGAGAGHWKQNTINGNRERGTGILNNELYIGRRVWNRLRYSKHPETGKRVSRLNPHEDLKIMDVPELRTLDDELWASVKQRQDAQRKVRAKSKSTGRNGLSVGQSMRRRKYLLSGLLTCGQCGGNLTIAGGGKTKRYYCSNAKEKGVAVCVGMPGIKEADAALTILSGFKTSLMQDEAYEEFRASYSELKRQQEKARFATRASKDRNINELTKKRANLIRAVETGQQSDVIISRLNEVDAELQGALADREASDIEPFELPDDFPSLYRAHVEDLVGTLSDEDVAGRASDELHTVIDEVIISWNSKKCVHELELRGKLLEMLKTTKPAEEAGIEANASSLKLVAGVGFEPTTFRL